MSANTSTSMSITSQLENIAYHQFLDHAGNTAVSATYVRSTSELPGPSIQCYVRDKTLLSSGSAQGEARAQGYCQVIIEHLGRCGFFDQFASIRIELFCALTGGDVTKLYCQLVEGRYVTTLTQRHCRLQRYLQHAMLEREDRNLAMFVRSASKVRDVTKDGTTSVPSYQHPGDLSVSNEHETSRPARQLTLQLAKKQDQQQRASLAFAHDDEQKLRSTRDDESHPASGTSLQSDEIAPSQQILTPTGEPTRLQPDTVQHDDLRGSDECLQWKMLPLFNPASFRRSQKTGRHHPYDIVYLYIDRDDIMHEGIHLCSANVMRYQFDPKIETELTTLNVNGTMQDREDAHFSRYPRLCDRLIDLFLDLPTGDEAPSSKPAGQQSRESPNYDNNLQDIVAVTHRIEVEEYKGSHGIDHEADLLSTSEVVELIEQDAV